MPFHSIQKGIGDGMTLSHQSFLSQGVGIAILSLSLSWSGDDVSTSSFFQNGRSDDMATYLFYIQASDVTTSSLCKEAR